MGSKMRQDHRLMRVVEGVALGFFLTASAAFAETWRGLELRASMQQAPWRIGRLRIQPRLVLSNAGVDSNVFLSSTDPVKDFTLTAGPAATVYLPFSKKFVLSVYGSPQYVWYSKTDRERTWNYYTRGSALLSLKNFFLSIEGVYSDARERWNTEIDLRPRRKEIGYAASILMKIGWKTSFEIGFRTSAFNYENIEYEGGINIRNRLNRDESFGTFSLYYQLSGQNRFFVNLEYGRFDFDFAEQAAISDSRSGAALAGFEFSPLGRRIRGRIRIGYKVFDVLNAALPDYRGLVGDTQVSVRLNKPLAIRASYKRDVHFSIWYDNPYYVESRPGVGTSLYLLRFLRLDYDYSAGRNSYALAGGGGADQKRLDDIRIHSTGFYFRTGRNTALGFIASWWSRDSNLDGEDDKRTFFGVNLTYDF
jgi:hypothetical protein